jgi:hypothetical protein
VNDVGWRYRRRTALLAATVALAFAATGACSRPAARGARFQPNAATSPSAGVPAAEAVPEAAPPPANLPLIAYAPAPPGFAADPEPMSVAPLTAGLEPTGAIAGYDAPGGRPLAWLAPTLGGVPLTMPIVAQRTGWTGVLLPSANRTIAWIPPGQWRRVALRDQLIVYRPSHRLVWLRDGGYVQSWPVALGVAATPTPLGRTFILGRSTLPSPVYAGTDVFALAAVPDDPSAEPPGLRGAHIGLHTWYNEWTYGVDATDGCIRLTRTGQRLLLQELVGGTELVVLNEPAPPSWPSSGQPTGGGRTAV